MDDCIITSDNPMRSDMPIHLLKNGKEKYIITEKKTIYQEIESFADQSSKIDFKNEKKEVCNDNQSFIAMTKSDKFTPRTKHITLKYHNFRSFVDSKKIQI